MQDYSAIDIPSILNMIFYPRKAYRPCPVNAFDLMTPVDEGVEVAARFYTKGVNQPVIFYFHGNGEVIYDYDDIASLYNNLGINLILADYRGYGASGGAPSFTNVCQDAKVIFKSVKNELAHRGYLGGLWIMGRSLGSVSALELAAHCQDQIKGLIIESGFANVLHVMKQWSSALKEISLPQFDQECLNMVKSITIPTLLLHGDRDEIVPFLEAVDMYENLGSVDKKMITIPNAGHNDIMYVGLQQYFGAIADFCSVQYPAGA
jgi:pimeloyl-ACP methyl ester carboxylesterase